MVEPLSCRGLALEAILHFERIVELDWMNLRSYGWWEKNHPSSRSRCQRLLGSPNPYILTS